MFFSPSRERLSSKSPSRQAEENRPPITVRSIFLNFGQEGRKSLREPKKLVLPLEEQQILNINCMNCQELVPLDKIEVHSKSCTSIPEAVQSMESGSYLTQIMFKLRKLESCLVELVQGSDLRPGDKNYVNIFTRLCKSVIEAGTMEQTETVIKSLSSLLVSFKGSLSIRVYADRLQALVQELKLGLQEQEIEKKKQELEKIKEEVEKYKHRSEVLQKSIVRTSSASKMGNINRKLDEITSEIGSLYSGSSEVTAMSGLEEEKQELEEPLTSSSNDLQKHFYSLCLTIKMKQANKARVQNISIQKLYNEAVSQSIPPDSWPDFINNQLKNPARWIDDTRARRRVQPKSSLMKPQYFEVIVEEDHSSRN